MAEGRVSSEAVSQGSQRTRRWWLAWLSVAGPRMQPLVGGPKTYPERVQPDRGPDSCHTSADRLPCSTGKGCGCTLTRDCTLCAARSTPQYRRLSGKLLRPSRLIGSPIEVYLDHPSVQPAWFWQPLKPLSIGSRVCWRWQSSHTRHLFLLRDD